MHHDSASRSDRIRADDAMRASGLQMQREVPTAILQRSLRESRHRVHRRGLRLRACGMHVM
jgi:hypothetical protein